MTVYELKELLERLPEDAEIIIYDKTLKWENVIDDKNTFSDVKTEDDGTPTVYLYTE